MIPILAVLAVAAGMTAVAVGYARNSALTMALGALQPTYGQSSGKFSRPRTAASRRC